MRHADRANARRNTMAARCTGPGGGYGYYGPSISFYGPRVEIY